MNGLTTSARILFRVRFKSNIQEYRSSVERPRILLADDSVTIRKVVELTFADEGIDVVCVGDGDAAMVSFVENQPDLVIADVNMPGVGGYMICDMIKQDDSTRDIPVILLTGSFEPFDPGEASRVGANYYFTKPFQSIRDLVAKVRDLLDAKSFERDTVPETEDIDGLYKDSFADTLKIEGHSTTPELNYQGMDAEIEAHQVEALEREKTFPEDLTVADLGYEGMDDEVSDPHPVETEHEKEFPKGLTVADLGYEGMDDETVEYQPEKKPEIIQFPTNLTVADLGYEGMDDELPLLEVPDGIGEESTLSGSAVRNDPFSSLIDLGDAGLDDGMIETTRPGEILEKAEENMEIHVADTLRFETPPAFKAESPIDPFEKPIANDDTTPKFGWDRATELEKNPDVREPSNLKFEIVDNETEETADPTTEILFDPEAPVPEHISATNVYPPELIEAIAQRVIEYLSDKVIREVAKEVVPKITENMIREALDNDGMK